MHSTLKPLDPFNLATALVYNLHVKVRRDFLRMSLQLIFMIVKKYLVADLRYSKKFYVLKTDFFDETYTQVVAKIKQILWFQG